MITSRPTTFPPKIRIAFGYEILRTCPLVCDY
jgi:hypothetical protein